MLSCVNLLSGTSEQVLAVPYAKSISAVESAAPSHASIEATDRFGYAWRTYKEVELVHHLSIYPTAVLWLLLRIGLGRIAYFRLLRQLTIRHLRSIVFEQMIPRIAHYWPQQTVHRPYGKGRTSRRTKSPG